MIICKYIQISGLNGGQNLVVNMSKQILGKFDLFFIFFICFGKGISWPVNTEGDNDAAANYLSTDAPEGRLAKGHCSGCWVTQEGQQRWRNAQTAGTDTADVRHGVATIVPETPLYWPLNRDPGGRREEHWAQRKWAKHGRAYHLRIKFIRLVKRRLEGGEVEGAGCVFPLARSTSPAAPPRGLCACRLRERERIWCAVLFTYLLFLLGFGSLFSWI